jgi:Rad3-related DNA helicase
MLKQAFSQVKSICLFSATLSPALYFKQCFGVQQEDIYEIRLGSPYPPENLQCMIESYSTRYKDRDQTLKDIVACIEGHLHHKPCNSIIFFPSYDYLQKVYDLLAQQVTMPLMVQNRSMTERDRDAFLDAFVHEEGAQLTGLCVLGGVFSEGIDLKADRLSLVVVIGVGLPMISLELQLIEDYYSGLGLRGYDYTYTIPGIVRVLQAGGRLIRDAHDEGRLVLIDDRYLAPMYQGLLPPHWKQSLAMGWDRQGL